MKCLVTGSAGFIGSHLSEALVANGHSVLGVDCFTDYYSRALKVSNLSALFDMTRFKLVEVDLASARLAPLLRGVDCVFHLAGQPGVRASWGTSFSNYVKDNVVTTQRLLEAVKQTGTIKKFVYASSSSIYGDAEALPTPETTAPKPVSPYGATKLTGENLCHVYFRNYSLPVVVLRYFTVYGPRQRPDMAFNAFMSKVARGQEITVYGDGNQRRDFTFVADTVAATILALRAQAGTVYNVGAGRSTSLNEVVSTIESVLGKKARIRHESSAPGDVMDTSADITRIKADLGYEPATTLTEGLKLQAAAKIG
ncbi:MAG TPA: NAD-dependent epimerase/dehydratase family protein [Nitrososphaerales archaeon]|nr:NAD-dependent epimerase/dehydratase family protein [Nitrososphaerales archaeon]